MKKKLEAELISIAHRILKLKNRSDIEQLQQETLRLYEKLSVLRFVEDNFSDVKPTIGYASAEEKLEEIYGLEEQQPPTPQRGNEDTPVANGTMEKEEAKTDDIKEGKPAVETVNAVDFEKNTDEEKQDKESDSGEGVDTTGSDESPASEEEIRHVVEETDEEAKPDEASDKKEEEQLAPEQKEEQKAEEKPAETPKLDFEQKPEEPKKQKEITFEDFHDYKEPEFIKKSDIVEPASINKEFLPKEPEIIAKQEEKAETMWEEPKQEEAKEEEPQPVRDWRDWEPGTSPYGSKAKQEEPKKEETKRSLNDIAGKTITLGLNDRIAFEKHLFGGSSEDLNRVLSQLNTLNSYSEACDFINNLVKPDYNDWKDKEEYEERFMAIVEKRFE